MALSSPAARTPLHARRYDFRGYKRCDGLFDIEGRIVDAKDYDFANQDRGTIQAGEPVHDMAVRLTLDERFVIRDIEAETAAGPFAICPAITANYRKLIGERLGRGWRQTLRELLGGTEGCTHITEMLGAMATVAFQTILPARTAPSTGAVLADSRPLLLNSCHAFASDSPVVRRTWPDHYTGPDADAAGEGGEST